MCHSVNAFFEARGDGPPGLRLVLDVTANRRDSPDFFNTICEVVMERNAYQWYTTHKDFIPKDPLFWESYIYELYGHNVYEMKAWITSFGMAFDHYFFRDNDYSNGATYFMTVDMFKARGEKPFPKTQPIGIVGNHIFFKSCTESAPCLTF